MLKPGTVCQTLRLPCGMLLLHYVYVMITFREGTYTFNDNFSQGAHVNLMKSFH